MAMLLGSGIRLGRPEMVDLQSRWRLASQIAAKGIQPTRKWMKKYLRQALESHLSLHAQARRPLPMDLRVIKSSPLAIDGAGGDFYTFLFEENKLIAVNRRGQNRNDATKFSECISAVAIGNSSSCLKTLVKHSVSEKLEESQFEKLRIKYTGWRGRVSPSEERINQVLGGVNNFFEKMKRKIDVPQVGDKLQTSIYSDKSADFIVMRADKVKGEKTAVGIRNNIVEWVYYCGQNSAIDSSLCVIHPK